MEALPESCQTFEVAAAQTSGLFNLVLSRQLVFSSASICPLIEMTDGHNLARYCKLKAIRPGFETIS